MPGLEGFLLQAPRLAEFLWQPAQARIAVQRRAGVDDATLEHLLLDQIVPRCLAFHGRVVAHAGTVRVGGRGALLMGPTGAGKSTLAALLARAGHELHSDDCVELEAGADGVDAIPTYPSLRMRPDSIAAVHPEGIGTRPMANYSNKLRLEAGGYAADVHARHFPAHALYLLDAPEAGVDAIGFRRLPQLQACMRLVQHSFQLDPGDASHAAAHLRRCADIARRLPAYLLSYPRDYTRSRELVEALAEHIRRH